MNIEAFVATHLDSYLRGILESAFKGSKTLTIENFSPECIDCAKEDLSGFYWCVEGLSETEIQERVKTLWTNRKKYIFACYDFPVYVSGERYSDGSFYRIIRTI